MAIAFNAATHSAYTNSTSNTLSHTTAGSNRILFVSIYAGSDVVTGVTYNGVAMTQLQKQLMVGAAAGQYIYLYMLVNPASGANNVVVSSSSGLGGYISAVSYTGAKQTGQPNVSNKQAVTSTTSLTTSVTTTLDNCWLTGYAYHNGTVVAGTATTLRGGSVNVLQTMDSNGAKSPAGSYSLNTTKSPADFAGHVMAAFAPYAATPQALTASMTAAASIAKTASLIRTLTASMTAAATVGKGFTEALVASMTASASIATQSINTVLMVGSMTASSTITKVSTYARTLTGSVTAAASATTLKSLFRTLTAAVSAASTVVAAKTFYQTLTAAVSAAASMTNGGAIRTTIVAAAVAVAAKIQILFYKRKYTDEDEDYKRKY